MAVNFEAIDEKMAEGYQLWWGSSKEPTKVCDIWLEAWDWMKELMDENGIKSVRELNKAYTWSEFPMNCVQELGFELHNAGLDEPSYHDKRIVYHRELLQYIGEERPMAERARHAIAEAYFEKGDIEECDRLFGQWLDDDPQCGRGYLGWFSCYDHNRRNGDKAKAGEIIERALKAPELRNRLDVVDRALTYYEAADSNKEKVAELRRELSVLQAAEPARRTSHKQIPTESIKVGRNDPCPCGSGKKYKSCHGKAVQP